MIKITLPNISLQNSKALKIKKNVFLVKHSSDKYILKQKRKSILNKLRYLNEVRIYQTLNNGKFNYLNAARAYNDKITRNLVLEFIEMETDKQQVKRQDFINAYQELQQIKPKKSFILDLYNKYFLGYHYKILMVSIFTISRKVNWKVSLKIILTFLELNSSNLLLSNRYWKHGDLHGQNYFYDITGKLYFIDFENMFYTRKWPLVEIITHCISYKNKIYFCNDTLSLYLKNIPPNSELWDIDLYKQCQLALMSHSIAVIAHTKMKKKHMAFTDLLNLSLDGDQMEKWFEVNINSIIKDQKLKRKIKNEISPEI